MIRICPKIDYWYPIYLRLLEYAKSHPCNPPEPPIPLILSGWHYSTDIGKKQRWEETITWSKANGCLDLLSNIPEDGYYEVATLSDVVFAHPDFNQHHEPKQHPGREKLKTYLLILKNRWKEIVGEEIGRYTYPLRFTGKKGCRLLVCADKTVKPPWGNWYYLSYGGTNSRAFTLFRASINNAISPHKVDHVDFTLGNFEQ